MLSSNTSGVSEDANYIESVFSTYLYTGTGAAQTINNGVDLAGKGGLTWFKTRTPDVGNYHALFDTTRGNTSVISSNATDAANTYGTPNVLASFNSNGFSLNATDNYGWVNSSGKSQVSWTFRKQPKFFDVVTWTGNSTDNRAISHSLGSTPGCIIVKNTTNATDWAVWHRSLASSQELLLNTTDSAYNYGAFESATSTTFTVNNSGYTNQTGSTYVAYIFAHDAGGFGLTGTDNVISCGSFTTNGSGVASVTLGYEPQYVLFKQTNGADNWRQFDNMRGWSMTQNNFLFPNTSGAETVSSGWGNPTATGFTIGSANASATYIYIAIRRGPMKVPTDGTKVFKPTATAVTTGTKVTTGFVTDLQMANYRSGGGANTVFTDRLRGIANTNVGSPTLGSANTNAEISTINYLYAADNTGWLQGSYSSGGDSIRYDFQRAPSFFDEVCYTGTGANTAITHNLGVTPELFIVKRRDTTSSWNTYVQTIGNTNYLAVETTAASTASATRWNNTSPTSTQFSLGTFAGVNASGGTYVAYLFATCLGVSKVGSYTGTGTTKQVDCGFAAGARFVLIKRTDSTGDWYVWDTARGIVSGNDPYLLLNSTAAEVTSTDYIDPYSAGFELSSTAPAALNASGGTYIFLAIA